MVDIRILRQFRHSERAILIGLTGVQRAVGRFRKSPRHPRPLPESNLSFDGIAASQIQLRILIAIGEQQGHQKFEHRAAPGKQLAALRLGPHGTAQGKPMFKGNVAFSNGHQAGQSRFAGEQIVVAGKGDRAPGNEAHGEVPPAFIIEAPHVHSIGESADRLLQPAYFTDGFRGVLFGFLRFGAKLPDPRSCLRRHLGGERPVQDRLHGGDAALHLEQRRNGKQSFPSQFSDVPAKEE